MAYIVNQRDQCVLEPNSQAVVQALEESSGSVFACQEVACLAKATPDSVISSESFNTSYDPSKLSPLNAVTRVGMFAGGGMGLMYPRLSVMTLALSTKDTEGFNSSAMSISDSFGGALALAATGIVFAAFTTTTASFAGCSH